MPRAWARRVYWLRRATGPLHLLSVSTLSRTPYASCAVAHVAANPLHAGAPSLNDGECLTHPAGVRAPGPCLHVANRYPLLGFSVRYGRLRLGAFQLCPLGDHAVLDVAPQGNQQPPRQGHDADAPHALAPGRKALGEPGTECAARLIAQPVPGELHQQRAHPSIARLADALLTLTIAAVVGAGVKPRAAGQLPAVAKATPAKQLACEQPSAGQANAAQLEQGHQRPRAHVLDLFLSALLQRVHLLAHQLLAYALALDFGPQPRGQLLLELRQTLAPAAPTHFAQAHVVQHRQGAHAIDVRVALALQALQLPVHSALVFLLHAGHAHHPPHALFAYAMANPHLVELGRIQPIALGPPRTPVDLDARGVHHHILDALLEQPAMQPEPVASRLVAAEHAHHAGQPAARLGLLNHLQQFTRIPGRYRALAGRALPVGDRHFPLVTRQLQRHVQDAHNTRIIHQGLPCRFHIDFSLVGKSPWTS